MVNYFLALGVTAVVFVPVWRFYFLPAYRGDFGHSPTCPCRECVPS